jgi:hypothetical protein
MRHSWPRTLLEMNGKFAKDLHGIKSYLDTANLYSVTEDSRLSTTKFRRVADRTNFCSEER